MERLRDQRVVVTGAGGFIGSHLVEALVPHCQKVTALIHYDSRPGFGNLEFLPPDIRRDARILSGNVADPFFMRRAIEGCDLVFHLAALISIPYSYIAPAAYFRTNVMGTLNVLEACRSEKVKRLVTVSTSECYGSAQYTPMPEEHPLHAQSPYSASKIGADKAVDSYYCSFGLPAVVIRPFNTYGPRQSARAVIPTIITQTLSGESVIRLGSLTPVRDLTFVEDTVMGLIAAAVSEGVEGETINLGVGQGVSIGELARRIGALTNISKEIVCDEERIRPEKSEVFTLISDNSKAARLLGWKPKIALDDGLKRTIDFVREHPDFYRPGTYLI